jgi:hypothetical protein
MAPGTTGDRRDKREEKLEEESFPPDRMHLDPDYLEHHDAALILKKMRDEQMRPLKFPT